METKPAPGVSSVTVTGESDARSEARGGDVAHAPKAPGRLGVRCEDAGKGTIAAEGWAVPDPRSAALAEDVVPAETDWEELIAVRRRKKRIALPQVMRTPAY